MMNLFSSKTILAALGAAVVFLATPASAQTSNVKVNVPFGFSAGDQTFDAGQYSIDVDNARRTCRVVSTETGAVSYLHILPVPTSRSLNGSDKAMVRFAKESGQYVLQGVWARGAVEGNTVLRSHRSRESAKAAPVREISTGSN